MAAIQTGLNAVTFNAMAVGPAQYMVHDWLQNKFTTTSRRTIFRAKP